MIYDIINALKHGLASVEWINLTTEYNKNKLTLSVMKDAIKFKNVPPLNYKRQIIPYKSLPEKERVILNGVRLPATAKEMQEIADLLFCMLMTPKIVDLVSLDSKSSGTNIESVINLSGKIVATCNIHDVHRKIEDSIKKAGGYNGGTVDSVGKYWVISNSLLKGKFGKQQAINYGWPTTGKGVGRSVTNKFNVWQTIGGAHNADHIDPSQVIRLVSRSAKLLYNGSEEWKDVDLHTIATDPNLAPLISHEGPLKILRIPSVPEPEAIVQNDGSILLPETIILG